MGERYADACFSLSAFRRDGACQAAIVAANFLKREVDNPEVRGIAFAEVSDEKNLMEVPKRLRKLPVVGLLTSRLSVRLSNPRGSRRISLFTASTANPTHLFCVATTGDVVSKTIRLLGTNDSAKGFDVTM